MGLYDWVFVKCKCPNPRCGKMEIREFQTKDLGDGFYEYEFGDRVGEILKEEGKYWIDFIDICQGCHCRIDARGIVREGILVGIAITGFHFHTNWKEIFQSYTWNKEKKRYIKTKSVKSVTTKQ